MASANAICLAPECGYPVAGCIVPQKIHLAAVVSRLRADGILRKGPNVTPFQSRLVAISPTSDACTRKIVGEYGLELCVLKLSPPIGDRIDNDDAFEVWTKYYENHNVDKTLYGDFSGFAVHVVSSLPVSLMSELFTAGVVCIVPQLRLYSAACYPYTEQLPASLQGLHKLVYLQSKQSADHGFAFTFCELFAGIGMFRLGLERAGGRCIFAVECAEVARAVYMANFHKTNSGENDVPFVCDITTVPSALFPTCDILTAGFPCQSFAKAGPATGLSHEKGWLFHEVVRVLHATAPKSFLLENVENLVHLDDGAQFEKVMHSLQNPDAMLSYIVNYRVVDGAVVSPQRRRRIYIAGLRSDLPEATAERLRSAMDCAMAQLEKYRQSHPGAPSCVRDVLDVTPAVGLRLTSSQWEMVRRSKTFRHNPKWRIADLDGFARTLMGSYRTSFQMYSEFVPLADVDVLRPSKGEPLLRFYSIRECARLQGIPESFLLDAAEDSHRLSPSSIYRLVGNAVNPIVIEHFGRVLYSVLHSKTDATK